MAQPKKYFLERTKFHRDITLLQKKKIESVDVTTLRPFLLDIIFISVKLFYESHKKKHGITVFTERDKAIIYIFVIKPSVEVVFRGYSWFEAVGFCAPSSCASAHAQLVLENARNIDSYPSLMHNDLRAETFCSGSQKRDFIDTQSLLNNITRCCDMFCVLGSTERLPSKDRKDLLIRSALRIRPPREYCWLTH